MCKDKSSLDESSTNSDISSEGSRETNSDIIVKISTCLRCNSTYKDKWYKFCPNCGKKLSTFYRKSNGHGVSTDEESYNKYINSKNKGGVSNGGN